MQGKKKGRYVGRVEHGEDRDQCVVAGHYCGNRSQLATESWSES